MATVHPPMLEAEVRADTGANKCGAAMALSEDFTIHLAMQGAQDATSFKTKEQSRYNSGWNLECTPIPNNFAQGPANAPADTFEIMMQLFKRETHFHYNTNWGRPFFVQTGRRGSPQKVVARPQGTINPILCHNV